jgi:ribosomal protein S18 acetylase RimI-like enzyme
MFEIAHVTYPDCPGLRAGYARTEAEWRTYDLGDPQVRLDLTAVAFQGDEVAGYSIVEDFLGRPVLVHTTVAVAPALRGRGIGPALLRAQAVAAKAGGLEALVAMPPVESLARLYEALGYRPRKTWLSLEGPLVE